VEHPDLARQWREALAGRLPVGWKEKLPTFAAGQTIATRSASGKVLNALAPLLPTLIGGSADLAPSNNSYLSGLGDFQAASPSGRNLRFGVREHAMGGVLNGLALHGGVRPFGATFFVFSDYMRPAIRLAALMHLPVVYVFTHDSIALGEDGPTHQPIEHLASLRAMPGLVVIRPSDAAETVVAWQAALERREGPTALVLTRQTVPVLDRTALAPASGLLKGAYVLKDPCCEKPALILIGTGSEVHIALAAAEKLTVHGVATRVVAMPSWELFEAQSPAYRERVLPATVKARVAVEAASTFGWSRYVGDGGAVVGIDRFGASAPAGVLYQKFGLTADKVVRTAMRLVE
jgi:transketolase